MSLPPPAGYGPYLPVPVPVSRRRLELGTLFGRSFRLMGQGFGPIAVLGLLTSLVCYGPGLALVAMYLTPFLVALAAASLTSILAPVTVAWGAVMLLGWLAQAQSGAMIAHLTSEVGEGRPADLANAWRATRGVIPRVLVPYLLATAGYMVAIGGTLAWFQAVLRAARADDSDAVGPNLAFLGAMLLLWAVGMVIGWVLAARWFCFLPVVSLEEATGFVALRRSWQLTRGVAGTIFGAQVISSIVLTVANGLVGQIASAPLGTPDFDRGGGMQDLVDRLIPLIVVSVMVSALFQALYGPFLAVMSTVAYRIRTLTELPAQPWSPAARPGTGYPPPAYPPGYPAPGYAPPGFPPPGYPPPGSPPPGYPPAQTS